MEQVALRRRLDERSLKTVQALAVGYAHYIPVRIKSPTIMVKINRWIVSAFDLNNLMAQKATKMLEVTPMTLAANTTQYT